MKCCNCARTIPDDATRCRYCEADQRESAHLTLDDMAAAEAALEAVMPGGAEQLHKMAEAFDTAEEFVNAVFVGECPACAKGDVGTYDEVVGVEDSTVARCFACGHIWCTECLQPIANPKQECGHWAACKDCDEECPHLGNSRDCPNVIEWISGQARRAEEN